MKTFFTHLHYDKNLNLFEKALVLCLTPVSFVYACVAEVRNSCYRHNIIKSYKPSVTTISIGNLTTGGTGKTPITAVIANYLTEKGHKVAILSRGYGSKLNPKETNVISDGTNIFYDAKTGGDEPVWLAENCSGVVVLTSSNRVKIAKYAQKLGCDILILDDGFQHQKLKRDVNILVVDSQKQFGNGFVLPAGPLREFRKNIARADKIIVVKKGAVEDFNDLRMENYTPCTLTTDYIYNIQNGKKLYPSGQKVLAFCAIGQPEQFYKLVREKGFELVKSIDFPDHHSYCEKDAKDIFNAAEEYGASVIITTEKDAVKFAPLVPESHANVYALKLKAEMDIKELLGY